jgi:hypothetical protein
MRGAGLLPLLEKVESVPSQDRSALLWHQKRANNIHVRDFDLYPLTQT